MRSDDPDVFDVIGPPALPAAAADVIAALSPVVTHKRLQRIEAVVAQRTDALVLVLDSIADPHNASAILRSADAFGVQTVHVVMGEHGFRASRGVSKGTHRWLDVVRHRDVASCGRTLREAGYHVYVAAMNGQYEPTTIPRNGAPLALVFGNEHRGVSQEFAEFASGSFAIPMRGFVESLNVSVAAAITLHALSGAIERRLPVAKQQELCARFLMNSVRDAERIVRERHGD